MKLSLMVTTPGKAKGQKIPIMLQQFIIGRDPQCNLRPASAMISKRHCALIIRNGKVFVRDFDSTNGTFVNDQQVKGEVTIKDKDQLKVGPLNFQVVIEAAVPVDKPTPLPAKISESSDDESVAAMLLALQDDGPTGGPFGGSGEEASVPGGSTIMDIVPVMGNEGKPEEKKPEDAKAEAAKAEAAKAPAKPAERVDTSQAAKMLLEKYSRRTRS